MPEEIVKSSEEVSQYLLDVRVVVNGKVIHTRCSFSPADLESGAILDWLKKTKELVDAKAAEC